MSEICIRGAETCGKGVSALTVGRERLRREFDGFLPTRGGNIPLLDMKGTYQAELYALVWGVSLMRESDYPVTVRTSSLAVSAWIRDRDCPEEYMDLFSLFLQKTKGKEVTAQLTDIGSKRMCGVRDLILDSETWRVRFST